MNNAGPMPPKDMEEAQVIYAIARMWAAWEERLRIAWKEFDPTRETKSNEEERKECSRSIMKCSADMAAYLMQREMPQQVEASDAPWLLPSTKRFRFYHDLPEPPTHSG